MSRFFRLYQYLGPALLTPLAAWLWWRHYDGNVQLVAIALLVPILHAYIVPGIGTNVLGMWAFNTRLKLGKFRPQHGFVFGSATAIITLPLMGAPNPAHTMGDLLVTAALVGAMLLAVNWVYDALAIRHRVLEVYNQPWADSKSEWAIAGDYVVWFFGLFGVIYGGGLRIAEGMLLGNPDTATALGFGTFLLLCTVCLPSLAYVVTSQLRHGHWGTRPVPNALIARRDSAPLCPVGHLPHKGGDRSAAMLSPIVISSEQAPKITRVVSPLVGEMSDRTEGRAVPPSLSNAKHEATGSQR